MAKAEQLRKSGKSYSEIRSLLGISKGTLSRWLRDKPLSKSQKLLLVGRNVSRYAGAKANQKKAKLAREKIFFNAFREAGLLFKDSFFVAGLMLYWAEGTKSGTTVTFTNSDPQMIEFMMLWFRKYCCIPESKYRVKIFIHTLLVADDWKENWAKITNLPFSQFTLPYIKPTITKHRKNKLYNGTCVIKINSFVLMEKIRGWHKRCVQEILKG
ncbi:MAG: helix-turn-helix domain-containing protein [Candidatus Margulisiibacteriota bacterium]